jgi:predicted pyridoxine 5'-phosphate oxidase superfamily flavin-nucleotide-binding protein
MSKPISDIAFTPAVKQAQERLGSRQIYAKVEQRGGWNDTITPDLAAFIAQRDSFYLGTASADGRPYIQHRGGPAGFLKVLDEKRLAFADYSGNRQYISVGNLSENDQAFIFLMDYPNRRRIKVWGRAELVDDDPETLAAVADPGYGATVERVFVFHVEAWDVNCPQHITPRFTETEIKERIRNLEDRIQELEEERQALPASASVAENPNQH